MTKGRQAQQGYRGLKSTFANFSSSPAGHRKHSVVPSHSSELGTLQEVDFTLSLPALLWSQQTGLLSLRVQDLSHWAPAPFLRPTSPSQRLVGVQSSGENLPTVAVMPGENRSSQNLLRKDVFPTAEFPTNTILKSWSGVDREPSSCG